MKAIPASLITAETRIASVGNDIYFLADPGEPIRRLWHDGQYWRWATLPYRTLEGAMITPEDAEQAISR